MFTALNPALAELLGYPDPATVVGLQLNSIFANSAEYDRLLEAYQRMGRIKGVETAWNRKDGTRVAVRLSGRAVHDVRQLFDGFELVVENIDERYELENQLRQAQKMRAIGELVGGIAHDLKNLMTIVVANAQVVHDSGKLRDSEVADALTDLRQAAENAAGMATKLLGFSRKGDLNLKPVQLDEVARRSTTMLRRLLPRHIELRGASDVGLKPVRADVGAVDQVLMNLVSNARDAMPEGGTLRIEVRRRWLDEEFRDARGWGEPGEYVVISVSDTGTGMDAETRSRIFEPFFTTKGHGAGTGLGMAMVMGLMKQHGGFIVVYSEEGQGTTVKTYFPSTADDRPGAARPADVVLPRGTETLLVVDDQDVIRRSAVRVLGGIGYQVLEASDGEEALQILSKNPAVHLVLSDIAMPRCSGPELYRKVRDSGSTVPFLFMSGYAATDLRARDRLSSDLFFIEKPWTVTDLAMLVRQVLDGSAKQVDLE